jgi:hypothetical protein
MKDISFAQKSILEQVLTQFQINNNKDFNEDNNFGNNLNKIQFILREKMRLNHEKSHKIIDEIKERMNQLIKALTKTKI